jgi:prolyl-tRNA synthetase
MAVVNWSKFFLFTLKENPADAEIPSHQLLTRSDGITKVAPGIFTLGPVILRAVRKFERIVREEHDKRDCIEILMPMVHPRELWEESGRWSKMGADLLKFKNRNDHEWCLGATHEEVVTDYVRGKVKSYRDLPATLYQIQTKYRDEIRPRFGLMRGREFIMKDAYSFDVDQEKALASYQTMRAIYRSIFDRLGTDYRVVKADTGMIGGDLSEEFHLIANSGEDQLLVGENDFGANLEVCPAIDFKPVKENTDALLPKEEFETPNARTIVELSKLTGKSEFSLVKTLFFATGDSASVAGASIADLKPIAVLLRGSDDLNPIKLKNALKLTTLPLFLTDKEVKDLTGASPGSCGPVGLKIPVYADQGIKEFKNFIVGANKDGFHLKNVNFERDFKVQQFLDLRFAKAGDKNPNGDDKLVAKRGIEIGHIFYLGQKYSEALNAKFLDSAGATKTIEMGCYGIGVTRTVQAVIEQCHDADGMIWPKSIAPFDVHIALLDPDNQKILDYTKELVSQLQNLKLDVFVDDRKERPGVKFKDADLLGFPLRIVLGARGFDANQIEIVERKTKTAHKKAPNEVIPFIADWFK